MSNLATLQRQLQDRWSAAAPRERLMVRIAVGVTGVALLWLVALNPAWSTLRKAPAELDRLDRELQQMRALSEQTQQLKQAVPVSSEQSATALRAAVQRLGPAADLTMAGAQAQVRLRNVPGGALAGFLQEVRQAARARPQEAELQSGPEGYSGRLVLTLPGAGGA